MKVGLSGTGRIGRLIVRKVFSQSSSFQINVINTTSSLHVLAHLLQYDSVHGYWDADIKVENQALIIDGHRVPVITERDPARLPWSHYDIELAIDSTGKFNDRQGASKHLVAGADRVVITAPGRDMDLTVVMGVNERKFDAQVHRLISTASCTKNCIAPILHILDTAFGVQQGWMTTVHAFTNDQKHLDNPHHDLRRARACTHSIIPTSTGVGKALTDVLPHLSHRIQGLSVRVPTQDVSLLDLQVDLIQNVSPSELSDAFKKAASGEIGKYVGYNELPLVSSDYIGNDKSAVIDGLSLMTRENQVKLLAWYDNEWGYASRVCDMVQYIAIKELERKELGAKWTEQTVS